MTKTSAVPSGPLAAFITAPVVDLVIPVHNEERDLEPCVRRLHAELGRAFPFSYRITIADNASGSLGLLHATTAAPARSTELAVLVLANLAATVARFVLLRHWVFGRAPHPGMPGGSA